MNCAGFLIGKSIREDRNERVTLMLLGGKNNDEASLPNIFSTQNFSYSIFSLLKIAEKRLRTQMGNDLKKSQRTKDPGKTMVSKKGLESS